MKQKKSSRSCNEWILWICRLLCIVSLSASGQTVTIVPEVDTLSLWGTCTPPGFICRLANGGQGVDRVVVRPQGAGLVRGIPPTYVIARYDSMYFQIKDSLDLDQYEIFFTNHSSFHPDHFRVWFDSTTYVLPGPCDLTLRVLRNGSLVDSAIIRFASYQTGLSVGNDQSLVPQEQCLFQNYPNPFNPTTTIRYGLPRRSHVTLSVYNTLGQRAAILVNESQEAGYHDVRFDGRGLASGVYFYRMSTGTYVETKTLLLIR